MTEDQEKFLRQRLAAGLPTPELTDAPLPFDDLEEVWKGFQYLSPRRPFIGMVGVPGPIPLTEVRAYMEVFGPSTELARLEFIQLIAEIDEEYIVMAVKKNKNPKGKKNA